MKGATVTDEVISLLLIGGIMGFFSCLVIMLLIILTSSSLTLEGWVCTAYDVPLNGEVVHLDNSQGVWQFPFKYCTEQTRIEALKDV